MRFNNKVILVLAIFISPILSNAENSLSIYFDRVIGQTKSLDLALMELGLRNNNKSIKVENKDEIKDYISNFRKQITSILQESYFKLESKNLMSLVHVNQALLSNLKSAVSSDLKELPALPVSTIYENIRSEDGETKALTFIDLDIALDKFDQDLNKLRKSFENIGLNTLNLVIRKTGKLVEKSGIVEAGKRAAPYGLFAGYLFLSSTQETINKYFPGLAKNKQNLDKIFKPAERHINGGDIVGCDPIVKISFKTVFDWSLSGYMLTVMTKDLKDLSKFASGKFNQFYAYSKGEPFKEDLPTKPYKETFKDILGQTQVKAELQKFVDYYKYKDVSDGIGVQVNHGYLLAGPTTMGKKIVRSLSGEVTKVVKEKNSKAFCGIKEIHASVLAEKKLKDIIEEVEKFKPTIILITEFDWLVKNKIKSPIWADIMLTINKLISDPKKEIYIFALTENETLIRRNIEDLDSLWTNVRFANSSNSDRKEFLKKELADRAINIEDFDLDDIIYQTQNCSLDGVNCMLKEALALAKSQGVTLNQDIVNDVIDSKIHRIVKDNNLSNDLKNSLSIYYAGKILAYNNIVTNNKLIKVTILPVTSINGISQGAFITSNTITESEAEIENSCLIELAGIKALENILGKNRPQSIINNGYKAVSQKAKDLILDDRTLTLQAKQSKLEQVEKLIKTWEDKASSLIKQNQDRLLLISAKLADNLTLSSKDIAGL